MTLEHLLEEGLEISIFFVPPGAVSGLHEREIGCAVFDPKEVRAEELDMSECVYGKSIVEVLEKAKRRWK